MAKLLLTLCVIIGTSSLVRGKVVFGDGSRVTGLGSREKRAEPRVLPASGLSTEDKAGILEAHIAMRESVGASVGNLLALTYSEDLASLAQLTSDSCKFVEDTSDDVGQVILYTDSSSQPGPPIQQLFASEQAAYDYTTNTCQSGQTCSNFKQKIAWYSTSKIGCGKKFCPLMFNPAGQPLLENGAFVSSQWFWVCNYQEVSLDDERPYLPSTKPCSLCNLDPGTICERNQCRACDPDTDLACRRPDEVLCVEDSDPCCSSWNSTIYCDPGHDRFPYMSANCGVHCDIYLCGTV